VPLIEIESPADPRLTDYFGLTDAQLRAREHRGEHAHFIAEGEGVVRHLLNSRFPVRSVLATRHHATTKMADVMSLLPASTPIYIATEAIMESITGFQFHRGVIASAERLPDEPLAPILAHAQTLVVCESLANIENLGAVFRNLACMVAHPSAVLLAGDCCHPLYRRALRVSMGHALRIPFARIPAWPDSMALLHDAGFTTLAMTPRETATSLREVARPARAAIILGTEGAGLSDATIAATHVRVKIPMTPGSDSLNVATSLAVALWGLS